jgi:hypothetical protein
VTITLRSCTSASRLTSTALRRAINSSPQRFASLARAGKRELVAGQRRPRDPDSVERVVLAGQAPLAARCAADLEHSFALLTQRAAQTGPVTAAALDRPRPLAAGHLLGEAKRFAIAVAVRADRSPRDNSTRRRSHDSNDVLVTVRVDTDHVVQLVCKHQPRSSDSLVGSGGAGLKRGTPRRQVGNESHR